MSCIIQSDNGLVTYYNNYLYDYVCNGAIINNICQNECVKYLIVNNLILTIILLLLVVSLIIFTIVLIVKPDAFCCRDCFCWRKEYNDGNFWNIGRLNDDIFIEGEGSKYSIV